MEFIQRVLPVSDILYIDWLKMMGRKNFFFVKDKVEALIVVPTYLEPKLRSHKLNVST